MDIRYQIFVSSTYEDLKEERKEVTQAILECGCFPAGMELFQASNKTQWEIIKKVIDESDFYLVIIAGRYGSLGTDDNGHKVSYTEMEFDYALNTNKPILALLHNDIMSLPVSKTDNSSTKKAKLTKFREKALDGRNVKFWDNKDNLKSAALAAINNMISDTDAVGWVRSNQKVDKTAYGIIDEQRRIYEEQISELNKQIQDRDKTLVEQNKTIEGLNRKLSEKQTKIDIVVEKNELLAIEISRKENFWFWLAQTHARLEYFSQDHNVITEFFKHDSISESTCSYNFFLSFCSKRNIWKKVTQRAFVLKNDFLSKTIQERSTGFDYLNYKLDDFIEDRDCFACSDEEFMSLFSVLFALVYLWTPEDDENKTVISKNLNHIMVICDDYVDELWDIECALSENDY